MEKNMQKNPVPAGGEFPAGPCRVLLVLAALIVVLLQVPIAQAREPAWNFSRPGMEIGGVAVSPAGDLIAVGAGKVLFFSGSGTLLAEEAFGDEVRITADGKYTASEYSPALYLFKNPLPGGSPAQQKATLLWHYEVSEPVASFDMNRDGSVIAGQTQGKSLFVLNTKTGVITGNNKQVDSVIQVSPAGGRIIGISPAAVHSYSSSGTLTRTADLTTNSAPRYLVLTSNGNSAVFNDGQKIRSVNTNTGKELWNRQVTGSVSALSMAGSGSLIVAGTESGTIAGMNANGNLSWSYASNPEDRQGAGITCIAVSDKGTATAAGTTDGKILFLDARGQPSGSSAAQETIRHIAMSSDGSVVAAATDSRVYVFSPGSSSSLPAPAASPSRNGTTVKTAAPSTAQTPETVPSRQETPVTPPTELPTTYSVIRTATQSPPALITLLLSLAVAGAIAVRKR